MRHLPNVIYIPVRRRFNWGRIGVWVLCVGGCIAVWAFVFWCAAKAVS